MSDNDLNSDSILGSVIDDRIVVEPEDVLEEEKERLRKRTEMLNVNRDYVQMG